jgi:tetratricopeptide (TPR) repeat protein
MLDATIVGEYGNPLGFGHGKSTPLFTVPHRHNTLRSEAAIGNEQVNSAPPPQTAPRTGQLLRFLEKDPANIALLTEAAHAAYDERAFDQAHDLLVRIAAIGQLPPSLINLNGLVGMAQQRYADAAAAFGRMRMEGHDAPAVRFNLAWAKAMLGAWAEASDLLDDDAIAASPRGPALKIEVMHHLEQYEDALEVGSELAQRFPSDQRLMGALATLAIDAEKPELARLYAKRGGDNPEASAALAVLMLGGHEADESLPLFERVIIQQPENARAWVGKGLALLSQGKADEGAKALDRGAALFEDHLGSWIAAGWAHFIAGDRTGARVAFERALQADENFSETHGGLAVLDLLEGKADSAKQRADIALRLDRNSFGGALAKSLLLEAAGDTKAAQRIRDVAMTTPIGPQGQTIAQVLARMAGQKTPSAKRP